MPPIHIMNTCNWPRTTYKKVKPKAVRKNNGNLATNFSWYALQWHLNGPSDHFYLNGPSASFLLYKKVKPKMVQKNNGTTLQQIFHGMPRSGI